MKALQTTLALVIALVAAFPSTRTPARAAALVPTSPCDDDSTHGSGTNTLCEGDGLHTDQYIVEPYFDYTYYVYYQSDGLTGLFTSYDTDWTLDYTYSEGYDSPTHVMYGWLSGHPASLSWFAACEEGECFDHALYYDGETDGATCIQLLPLADLMIYDQGCSRQVQDFPFISAPLTAALVVARNGSLLDSQIAPHWHLVSAASRSSRTAPFEGMGKLLLTLQKMPSPMSRLAAVSRRHLK